MTYNCTASVSRNRATANRCGIASRSHQYDTLGRPTSRTLARQGATRNDVFTYNDRSELISDVVHGTGLNGWDYDRAAAASSSGVASRPVLFTKDDNSVSVACTYDYMGRRATKVVTENGVVTTSHRFLYRGYLQVACCDRTRSTHPCLWLITWDPTQDVATRPLAIQKDGTWYTYGWDLTKNIWEAYTTTGYIGTAYTYTAYGQVTANGSITQPILWSSEYNDTELALVYYNYRHYNPIDGRWIGREPIFKEYVNNHLYKYLGNSSLNIDFIGLTYIDEPLCLYPTGGIFGTVNARYNKETAQIEVETEKWIMPSWYQIWVHPVNTGERSWRAATEEEINIYIKCLDNNEPIVEDDPGVLFARSYGEIRKALKIDEQVYAGNVLVDLMSIWVPAGSATKTAPKVLVHYSSKKCIHNIESQGFLIGKSGIYATNPNEFPSFLRHIFMLGLGKNKVEKFIDIPIKCHKDFHKVKPIGLYSLIKYLGEVYYTAPGKINITTEKFIRTGSPMTPWIESYAVDILIHAVIEYMIWIKNN